MSKLKPTTGDSAKTPLTKAASGPDTSPLAPLTFPLCPQSQAFTDESGLNGQFRAGSSLSSQEGTRSTWRTSPNVHSHTSPSPSLLKPHTQRRHTVAVAELENGGPSAASHRIPALGPRQNDASGPQIRSRACVRTADPASFPRLSRPVELMRGSYDTVVIGSGYGGGVAASRVARSERRDGTRPSVCVLERGRERWPGEYPVSTADATKDLHVSGEFAPGSLPGVDVDGGDPVGMYHLMMGRGLNAFVGNGLGGTSLINANVFLEVDTRTLETPFWPPEIRENPDCLKEYYQKARDVLEPAVYPDDWPRLSKVDLLRRQADVLGMSEDFYKVPQTTRFHNGPNSCGVDMAASSLTGQDSTGLNDGSKNSTLVTYLADAWNWGAEIYCECEVRHVEAKSGPEGGYIVYFAWHAKKRGRFRQNLYQDLMWVHARECVFLGAGALGTTEILLRSSHAGLPLSPTLGTGMSGNGDMLAFAYNTAYNVNAVGKPLADTYSPTGPTINAVIDRRYCSDNPLNGYVIQDGAIPYALVPFMQTLLEQSPGRVGPPVPSLLGRITSSLAELGSRLLGPYYKRGSMQKTQVYLVMSHDSGQAVLNLKNDKPYFDFLGVGRGDHVKELYDLLAEATTGVGGTLVQNPFYPLLGKQELTVHPIGGARMAPDGTGETGVANHIGELFSGRGHATHHGLIVVDGAMIPTSLGVNPLATITALAERAVHKLAGAKGWHVHTEHNGILDLYGEPRRSPSCWSGVEDLKIQEVSASMSRAVAARSAGITFTEAMAGYLHTGVVTNDTREGYEQAARTARRLCQTARSYITVEAPDARALAWETNGAGALLTGTFACQGLVGSPFVVRRGGFDLFVADDRAPGTRNLRYDFDMTGVDGRVLHFYGYKLVDSSVALSPAAFFRATTTLYVTISDRSALSTTMGARVLARGIMTIRPRDLASQVLTITPTGTSALRKLVGTVSFFSYFVQRSLSLLLVPLAPLEYPTASYRGFVNDTSPDASFSITAADNVRSRLHMWGPRPLRPVPFVRNLLMIPGSSVDHQVFALPTIECNAVNFFRSAGYRVFVVVTRIGKLMVAQNGWTTYDARLDIQAAFEYIRRHHPDGANEAGSIYTIAHCMGSVALSCGMLDGTVPARWLTGLTCSQVFMNPVWAIVNMAKILVGPIRLDQVYSILAGQWFSLDTSPSDTVVQRVINQLLRLYPVPRGEVCSNASCHRCSLVFGRLWNHRNLNEATHRQVDRFFGGINMTLLRLLMRQGAAGSVMDNQFTKLTSARNIDRLRGVPIMLFSGSENAVLTPESTERTYEALCNRFGSAGPDGQLMYRRRLVPGYGHLDCWMGREAHRDVYPFILTEIDRIVWGGTPDAT